MPALFPDTDVCETDELVALLRDRRVVVLGGAGCSTESGIPDYRGPAGRMKDRSPIQYGEFVGSELSRARYWARSSIGWGRVHVARPNPTHRALARLEEGGAVRGIITQNVDGLHQAAGSRRVVELHGSLARVRCLACRDVTSRAELQERIVAENRAWLADLRAMGEAEEPLAAPDGDAEVERADWVSFRIPACTECAGVLKPDVVFFGENVPSETVADAWALFEEGDVLLVAGSSLTVFSGRRFVYRAQKAGVPVAIVNVGPTRADDLASAKVEGRLGTVLPRLADELLA